MEWLSIRGHVEFNEGQLKYIPTCHEEGPNKGKIIFTKIRSNIRFENGEISFEFKTKGTDSACQLILNETKDEGIFVGISKGSSLYTMMQYKQNMWEIIDSSGYGDKIPINKWVSVKIKVYGSQIDLFINNVKVCQGNERLFIAPLSFYFFGEKEVIVRKIKVKNNAPKVFVIMQFTDEYNELYNEVIKPTCENFGFECIRADDEFSNNQIIADITRSIREASVIIADITPNNLNVYYEVGYAHGIAKPTILLSEKKRETLPFDLSGVRTLFYDNTIGGKKQIEERLEKHLENITLKPFRSQF